MGCSLGHYFTWKHAYENGYENVLIFEDDVIYPSPNMDLFTDCLNIFLKFIENNLYDVFYFGGSVITVGGIISSVVDTDSELFVTSNVPPIVVLLSTLRVEFNSV